MCDLMLTRSSFILWASTNFALPILQSFIDAPPTAELEPITETYTQSDEADMGMSYNELSVFGMFVFFVFKELKFQFIHWELL